jgi:hypothetical protein
MTETLEQLVREALDATKAAGELSEKLTRLEMAATGLEAHPLALVLLRQAEANAQGVASALRAAVLRLEQARLGLPVPPVGESLAAGRCRSCLGMASAHHTWCPEATTQGAKP